MKGIVKLKISLTFKLTEYKKNFTLIGIKFTNKSEEIKTMSSSNIFNIAIDKG